MVDKEQELNRQATDDHKDCFNKEEIGSDHAQQSHSDEHPLLELTSTMDAGNIVPLQNLKTVFLVGKEKRKRSPSSPDHSPRLSKRANNTQERTEKSMQEGERYLERGLGRGENSGEKCGSDKEREVMVDQTNAGKIAVSKAQRIGGVMQKDKQQDTLKQLQDQLTEEQRQTENLAKQREEIVSRQGQLQSQLQKERTQNERMKEKYLILRQQVEEMSKHKTAFKCLGCDAINYAHVTVTSRNALQLLRRDSGTCRYHRHLTEFVRKRMPLITETHSPEVIRQPSFSQLPREELHSSHGDQEQQPPLQQEDQQVLAQEQQTLQDQDELSTNPSSSSCQDEQSLSSQQEQHSPQPSLNQEEQNPTIHVLSSSSQEELEELSLIQPSLHSQPHRHQPLVQQQQQQQRSSLHLPYQTMTQQHKTLHQHESHHEPKQNQSMIKQHHQPKQLLHNQTFPFPFPQPDITRTQETTATRITPTTKAPSESIPSHAETTT